MKQNTFEPCKDHENGHFGWCLLCENEQLREVVKNLQEKNDNQRRIIEEMGIIESKYRALVENVKYANEFNTIVVHTD